MSSVASLLAQVCSSRRCAFSGCGDGDCLAGQCFVSDTGPDNQYVDVDVSESWCSQDMRLCGDRCVRANCVNGVHVFHLENRLCLVWAGRHAFFPCFGVRIGDVYAEPIRREMEEDRLLVVLATLHELRAVIVLFAGDDDVRVVTGVTLPLSTAPARLHRCGPTHLAMCYVNGKVDLVEMAVNLEVSSSLPLVGLQLVSQRVRWGDWLASLLFSARTYVDSCIDIERDYLTVLTNGDITVYRIYPPMCTDIELVCVLKWSDNSAVAVTALGRACAADRRVCRVIFRDGACAVVHRPALDSMTGADGDVTTMCDLASPPCSTALLCVGKVVKLPVRTPLHNIDRVCHANGTTVMYDRLSQMLTILCEDVHHLSPHTGFRGVCAVSQMYVSMDHVHGIGFCEEASDDAHTVFWIYGDGSILFLLRRVTEGRMLRLLLSENDIHSKEAWDHFCCASMNERSALLWAAVYNGLACTVAKSYMDSLRLPCMIDAHTIQLSPAAVAMTSHLIHDFELLHRLCHVPRYVNVTQQLRRLQAKLQAKCVVTLRVLDNNRWLSDAAAPPMVWSQSCRGVSSDVLTERSAISAEAQFMNTVVATVQRVGVSALLYCMLLESNVIEPDFSIRRNLSSPVHLDRCLLTLSQRLLSLRDARVVELLCAADVYNHLPASAQLVVRVHRLCNNHRNASALDLVCRCILQVREDNLFTYLAESLELGASPDLLPRLRMTKECSYLDVLATPDVVALLAQIPSDHDELLYRSLRCILDDTSAHHLHAAVLQWMTSHSIDDERLITFSRAVSDSGVKFGAMDSLAAQFMSYWCEYHRGASPDVARHFGELARTSAEMSIKQRLVCAEFAVQHKPIVSDTMTHFALMLQQQLLYMLQRYAAGSEYKNYPRECVEADIEMLSTHFLSDMELFDMAGRYRELGGASIQLDVLKVQTELSDDATSEVLMAMLNFLRVSGLCALDAARCVLHEYVPVFASPLPLLPFIEFLQMEKCTIQSVVSVLMSSGVTPLSVLSTLLDLLEFSDCVLYSANEVADAMVTYVSSMDDADQRRVCAAYLLEYIHTFKASESAYGVERSMNKSAVDSAERKLMTVLS